MGDITRAKVVGQPYDPASPLEGLAASDQMYQGKSVTHPAERQQLLAQGTSYIDESTCEDVPETPTSLRESIEDATPRDATEVAANVGGVSNSPLIGNSSLKLSKHLVNTASSTDGVASDSNLYNECSNGEDHDAHKAFAVFKRQAKGPALSLFVFYIVSVAAISGLLFGYDTGVIAGALVVIKDEWGLNSLQQEFVVGATTLGAIGGGLSCGVLADYLGRKLLTTISAVIFIAGALLMTFAPGYAVLVGGRVVVGVGVGIASMTVPMYISEVSPRDYRGRLVTVNVLTITGGQLIAYLVAWGLTDTHNGWRWMFAISAFPVALQLCCMPWFPESPRHLIKKGQIDRARRVLNRIYANFPNSSDLVEAEINDVWTRIAEEGSVSYRDLLQPGILRAVIVACILQASQQLTGFNTVMYYSSTILKMAGFSSNKSANQFSIAIAATNMLMTIVAISVVDRLGRRRLLLTSLAGMCLGLVLIGIAFIFIVGFVKITSNDCTTYPKCGACILDDKCGWSASAGHCVVNDRSLFEDVVSQCNNRTSSEEAGTWVALVSLIFYVAIYGLGLGNIPWLVQSEIFSHGVRSKAASFATATNWSSNFLISMIFLTLTQHITASATFWLFAVICVISFMLVFLMLYETKGRSLEEVRELFKSNIPPYRLNTAKQLAQCAGDSRAEEEEEE